MSGHARSRVECFGASLHTRLVRHACRGIVAASMFVASVASAQEPGPSGFTRDAVRAFGAELQAAVRDEKPRGVARLVAFPLQVNFAEGDSRKLTKKQFLRRYSTVFTPTVRQAVIAQGLDGIHESWRGIMFGDGAVWAGGACAKQPCSAQELKVIAVNVRQP